MKFASRLAGIDISGIRRMFDLAGDEDVINLALGEPDFPIPPESKEAISRALEEDFTHYTPSKGIPELRKAIVQRELEKGASIKEEEIIVTSGASEALHLALLALVEAGDEVLIPDPGFVSYKPLVEIAGGRAIPYFLLEEDNFDIDLEALKEQITDKTHMIIMNSPSNPTGAVLSEDSIKGVAEIADEAGIPLLSDEIYDEIIYDGKHHSPTKFTDNAIIVKGFSKSYAMTGLRLGYVYAGREAIEEMIKVHQYIQASTCSLSQRAALAALDSRVFGEKMVAVLRTKRDLILQQLGKIPGVTCITPGGAFYVFPNFSRYGDSNTLVMKFLREARVVATPGTAFGQGSDGYIRFSYATGREKILEGIKRIRRCFDEVA
ncbi:MAG: pyridoxal phosphate-dependent aminotransferase [Candidatus Hydrothermarchaeota archaeon]|nr:pyridoxal phosphate-dependent aminotransferase [Candidatus Hydrothermarchaeota archaeon]